MVISLTKLLFPENQEFGDPLRYGASASAARHGTGIGHGPVVVWQATRTCNLSCIHCYATSERRRYPGELTTAEARAMIDDLAAFRVPALLLSGGEPMARQDIWDLAAYARDQGLRITFSTNGTLIDDAAAARLKELNVGYVGISVDGAEALHDRLRGQPGAFRAALRGIRRCREAGVRVGLRFTIHRLNLGDVPAVLDLVEAEQIQRVCFYHLVYTGRADAALDIGPDETRRVLDRIVDRVETWHRDGFPCEVLTVDNHADAVYLYLRTLARDPVRAAGMLELLQRNGGNRSGIAIGYIDHLGNVHPDQFTPHHTFGNIREQPFSQIWTEARHPLLAGLKDRKPLLGGRCASCQWLGVCNGNFRTRAEAVTGDFWAPDPACYLTDQEIGVA